MKASTVKRCRRPRAPQGLRGRRTASRRRETSEPARGRVQPSRRWRAKTPDRSICAAAATHSSAWTGTLYGPRGRPRADRWRGGHELYKEDVTSTLPATARTRGSGRLNLGTRSRRRRSRRASRRPTSSRRPRRMRWPAAWSGMAILAEPTRLAEDQQEVTALHPERGSQVGSTCSCAQARTELYARAAESLRATIEPGRLQPDDLTVPRTCADRRRIEDDVVVTPDGCETCPRRCRGTRTRFEAWMAGRADDRQ